MKKHKIALLIGRFQPFHLGHLYLIKKALKNSDTLVIGIGSANIIDDNNPLDYETRLKIIKAVVYKENLTDKILKIVPLDDFYDDKIWLENVKKRVGEFNLVVGNNDWVNLIMEKASYKVLREPYFKRYLYEGWRIRELIKQKKRWLDRVPDYLRNYFTSHRSLATNHFNHVVLGGTFDHFHIGHHALIDKAIALGDNITIGVATGKLLDHKLLKNLIEPFSVRKNNVKKYIAGTAKIKIIAFSDIFGNTLIDPKIDAIIVSKMTLANAVKINIEREKIAYKPMKIIVIPDVLDDTGKMISSERIRMGEVNKYGKTFQIRNLSMPENLRKTLRKPLGKVIKGSEKELKETAKKAIQSFKKYKPTMVIAVGDIIAMTLANEGFNPDVKIIDNKSRRVNLSINPSKVLNSIKNDPGTISAKASLKIRESISVFIKTGKKQAIVINGEEDLLALPAIFFAPIASVVLYGHWQLGIVAVQVTENIKKNIFNILSKFI